MYCNYLLKKPSILKYITIIFLSSNFFNNVAFLNFNDIYSLYDGKRLSIIVY